MSKLSKKIVELRKINTTLKPESEEYKNNVKEIDKLREELTREQEYKLLKEQEQKANKEMRKATWHLFRIKGKMFIKFLPLIFLLTLSILAICFLMGFIGKALFYLIHLGYNII